MPIPSIAFTPTGGVQQVLAPPAPRPGSRLRGFTPDSIPIGPARPVLADGAIYGRRFRTDRLASFELPGLSADQLETAQALKVHLLNGGTATLATDDAADRSYTIRLAPDTVPQIRGPDSEFYEYTFAMTALNTAAASMVCTYGDAAVILRAGDNLADFARTGAAWYYVGPAPLRLASVATDIARSGHYHGGRRTLLVEAQRTNLVLRSDDHGTAPWSAVGTPTRTASAIQVGLLKLELIGDDDAVVSEGYEQTITFTGDGDKGIMVHLKRGTSPDASGTEIKLRDGTAGVNRLLATVTWSADGVPSVAMTTGLLLVTPLHLDQGVYEFRFEADNVVAANSNIIGVFPVAQGDQTGNVYVGGWQAENASIPSSYIVTAGSTVTRNAEAPQVTVPFVPQATWVYARFIELGTIAIGGARVFQLGGAAAPHLIVFMDSNVYTGRHANGITQTQIALASAPTRGNLVELLYVLESDGRHELIQSINSAAPTTTGASGGTAIGLASAWSSTDLWIGCGPSGGDAGFAAFERVAVGRGSLGSGAARLMQKARSIAG